MEVSTGIEHGAHKRLVGREIATDHRGRPRQRAVAEYLEVRVERTGGRWQSERDAAVGTAEVARLAAEVELDHRALRHGARLPPRERRTQEAGFEDRELRAEPEPAI